MSSKRNRPLRVALAPAAAAGIALIVLLLGPGSGDHRRLAFAAPRNCRPIGGVPSRVTLVEICPGPGLPVPASFLGLSTEYGSLTMFEKRPRLLARVLALLRETGAGPLILRVGGTSADHSFWDPSGRRLPGELPVTPAWLRRLRPILRHGDVRLILDLNLATARLGRSLQVADAAERLLPHESIAGIEIGNEPDRYTRTHLLAMSPTDYARAYRRFAPRLARVGPGVPLVAPALAYPKHDVRWLRVLLDGPHPGLGVLSGHLYPYSACAHAGQTTYPTVAKLLSPSAAAGLAEDAVPAVGLAERARLPFRLTEINSVNCGGLPGVSDSFATALWAPEVMFDLLRVGVTGVDVHVRAIAINGAFAFGARGLVARPLLYGLIAFARTLGAGARLLPLRPAGAGASSLGAWAVHGRDGRIRLLLINRRPERLTVEVGAPPALRLGSKATVERLLAPSPSSTSGVSVGGRHLDRGGGWAGRPVRQLVRKAHRRFALAVPGDSAALVSLR